MPGDMHYSYGQNYSTNHIVTINPKSNTYKLCKFMQQQHER